ncbi:MAG: hypothetical protein H5U19_14500 [Rhodobacteraceae bacterium]|nr:hypothetical protein [Paracoccaceae bacterium]
MTAWRTGLTDAALSLSLPHHSLKHAVIEFSEKALKPYCLLLGLFVIASEASSQSAIERHAWQDARSFQPISRTAVAITGTITLSGNSDFASKGSTMSMTFANGATVGLTSEGAFWRNWSLSVSGKQTAEIFRFSGDPGALENNNTLCDGRQPEQQIYAVFFESSLFDLPPTLNLAIFQSIGPPLQIDSPGLCGTFSYEIDPMIDDAGAPDKKKAPSAVRAEYEAWRLRTSTNPIDDSKTVTLSLVAETGESRLGNPVTFVARCQSNKTEAYVIWGDYLGDDSRDVYSEWKNVTVRIGDGEARQERWGVSTDREATFAPTWAGDFLKELLDQNRLVLKTTPYGENPNIAIFDVSGLRGVLGELAGTCNWSF